MKVSILGAVIAFFIIVVFIWIIQYFLSQAGVAFPTPIIWLLGLIIWLGYVTGYINGNRLG